jgi:hypothetical protein
MRLIGNCVALYLAGMSMGAYLVQGPSNGSLAGLLASIAITLVVIYELRKLYSGAGNKATEEKGAV